MQAQIQRLKESCLTIRGDGDQDPVANEVVYTIVRSALFVRVQRLRNGLCKAVKGAMHKTYSPLDDHWVILTTLEGVSLFEPDKIQIQILI